MNLAVTMSHGDASYPFVEPKLPSLKKGSTVKVLGDYMISKNLNNSPDKKTVVRQELALMPLCRK